MNATVLICCFVFDRNGGMLFCLTLCEKMFCMDTNKTKPASGAARLAAVGGAPLARVLKEALTRTVTHTGKRADGSNGTNRL